MNNEEPQSTSTAVIVMVGKKDYIQLNKKDGPDCNHKDRATILYLCLFIILLQCKYYSSSMKTVCKMCLR